MTLASRWYNHHVSQVFHGFLTKVKHHHKLSFPTLSDLLRLYPLPKNAGADGRSVEKPGLLGAHLWKDGRMLWIRNHHVEIQCSVQRGVNNYNILLSTVHKQNHHFVALCFLQSSLEALKRGPFPYLEVLFMRSCAIVRWKLISHLFSMLLFPGLEKKKRREIWEQKIFNRLLCDSTCLEKRGGWAKATSPLHDKMLEIQASLEQTQVLVSHVWGLITASLKKRQESTEDPARKINLNWFNRRSFLVFVGASTGCKQCNWQGEMAKNTEHLTGLWSQCLGRAGGMLGSPILGS